MSKVPELRPKGQLVPIIRDETIKWIEDAIRKYSLGATVAWHYSIAGMQQPVMGPNAQPVGYLWIPALQVFYGMEGSLLPTWRHWVWYCDNMHPFEPKEMVEGNVLKAMENLRGQRAAQNGTKIDPGQIKEIGQ